MLFIWAELGISSLCCDISPGRHGLSQPIIMTTSNINALGENGGVGGFAQSLRVPAGPRHALGHRLRTGAASIQTICVHTNLTWPCQALSISYVNERAFPARLKSFWNEKNIPSWLPLTHHSRGGLEHDNLCFISLHARPTRHDPVARQIPTPLPFPQNQDFQGCPHLSLCT
jgi:hypothetical protein